jgi:hypothetical protein
MIILTHVRAVYDQHRFSSVIIWSRDKIFRRDHRRPLSQKVGQPIW